MIRGGLLCKSCRAGHCCDTDISLDCPDCNGLGCGKCKKQGRFDIKGCPQDLITRTTREIVKYSELTEKGYMPIDGGVLNQSASFIEHCQFYNEEKNRVEAERHKR